MGKRVFIAASHPLVSVGLAPSVFLCTHYVRTIENFTVFLRMWAIVGKTMKDPATLTPKTSPVIMAVLHPLVSVGLACVAWLEEMAISRSPRAACGATVSLALLPSLLPCRVATIRCTILTRHSHWMILTPRPGRLGLPHGHLRQSYGSLLLFSCSSSMSMLPPSASM